MAIVQISKIQLRTGLSTELPDSLDEGEIGFASDTGELFIGSPSLQNIAYRAIQTGANPNGIYPYRNIKILTELDFTHTVTGDIFTIGPLAEYDIAANTSAALFTCDVPASNIFIDFSLEESLTGNVKGAIVMSGTMNIIRFEDPIALVKIYDYLILDDIIAHPVDTLTLESLSWAASTDINGSGFITLSYTNTTSRQFTFRILSSAWSPMYSLYGASDPTIIERLDNSPYASQNWVSKDFQNLSLIGSVLGQAQVTTLTSGYLGITIPTTLAPSGVIAGTYSTVTVNPQGIVTSGSSGGFITGNQPITLNGDISGNGTTTISTTLVSVMTPGTYSRVVVDAKGRVINDSGNIIGTGQSTTINNSVTSNVHIDDTADVWILTIYANIIIDFSNVTATTYTQTKTIVLIGDGTHSATFSGVVWDMGVTQIMNSANTKRTIYSFMKFPIPSDSNVYGGRAVYQP